MELFYSLLQDSSFQKYFTLENFICCSIFLDHIRVDYCIDFEEKQQLHIGYW